LISHPREIRQHQKKQHEDGEQARNMLKMFPEAFRFQYDGTQGSLVRLKFAPNPKFRPPDHATQVFHHMTGTMLVDPKQKRLAAINGTLTSEVKFFGGVFGHLDKGGTFEVRQQEVAPRVWEVTAMHVHMNGKALLFKTIAVQEDETYSDFHGVPPSTTLAQAAELLKREGGRPPADRSQELSASNADQASLVDSRTILFWVTNGHPFVLLVQRAAGFGHLTEWTRACNWAQLRR
jgi:hypothetical protein